MSSETRARLAAQQADLVAALVGHAPAPTGFDESRVQAAKRALSAKRRRAALRVWPGLASIERFVECFDAYARAHPLPRTGGAMADSRAFVRFLAASGDVPEELLVQALDAELRLASRYLPVLKLIWLRGAPRLVVGVRLPFLGTYIFGRRHVQPRRIP